MQWVASDVAMSIGVNDWLYLAKIAWMVQTGQLGMGQAGTGYAGESEI